MKGDGICGSDKVRLGWAEARLPGAEKKLQEKPIAGFFSFFEGFLQAALFTMPTLKVTELKLTGR